MKIRTSNKKKLKAVIPEVEQDTIVFDNPIDWTPHKYQKKGVKFLLEHAAAGLFLDPGLGKTSITLAAIKFLIQKKIIKKVLLIAPKNVCYVVWPDEAKKWTDFRGLRYVILHGTKKDQMLQEDADIYIINPEGLEWLLQVTKTKSPKKQKTSVTFDMRRWKSLKFDTLVVDELTRFKHTNNVRFKMIKLIAGTFARRWGLTGTPAPNGLEDLFGQCYVLDLGKSLGQYITHFRNQYFIPSKDGFNWEPKDFAEEEIYKKISKLALRMSAEDYLDMPKLIENNIMVELPDEARGYYKELEKELITLIKDKVITAKTSAVSMGKCRQMASGGVYLDKAMASVLGMKPKREWIDMHEEKLDALENLVEELQGSPLLVAYDFEQDLDRLKRRFGKNTPHIGNGVSPKQTKAIVALWNKGKLPLLFVHPQSASLGFNLQGCGYHICWFTPTWDYELYDQLNRRLWRQGNKSNRVFIHHILAKDTVDEYVMEALKSKKDVQNALFAALQRLAKKRS